MTGDTKALIADKLLELAKKRGLDKVTVNQIVEECGISRQGFYYYYQDTRSSRTSCGLPIFSDTAASKPRGFIPPGAGKKKGGSSDSSALFCKYNRLCIMW